MAERKASLCELGLIRAAQRGGREGGLKDIYVCDACDMRRLRIFSSIHVKTVYTYVDTCGGCVQAS